jgi:hypothetical protein
MNTYYSGQSTPPAGLFSFSLLDGPPWINVLRTDRLTILPARPGWVGKLKTSSHPLRDGIHE